MDDPTVKDFESALAELETIVQTLEDGQLTLEQSLERFERGITLSRYCHTRLEAAEKRIDLLNERGELRAAPDGLATDGTAENGTDKTKRGSMTASGGDDVDRLI